MSRKKRVLGAMLMFFGLMFAACGGGSSGSASVKTTDDNGTLSIFLADTATTEFQAVYVTIKEIQIHTTANGWETIAEPNQTFNLLDLVNGVMADLGSVELPEGKYTQIRLILGDVPDASLNILNQSHPFANYLIDSADEAHELKVPSGFQTGIKIVGNFEIGQGALTEILIDFDALHSIVRAGNSGQWILKPVIKIIDLINASIIKGTVTDASTGDPVQGAMVMVQNYSGSAEPQDQVETAAATLTCAYGNFSLWVSPGTYQVVVTKTGEAQKTVQIGYPNGYESECALVAADPSDKYTQDFTLTPASTGGLKFVLNTARVTSDDALTVSVRTLTDCADPVEVASANLSSDTETYTLYLAPGQFSVVAYTENGLVDQADNVTVEEGNTTEIDIDWP